MSSSQRRDRSGDGKRDKSQDGAEGITLNISADNVIGNGSFGVVFEATIAETGEKVAVKKVLQDKRFKNRELQIMKQLSHCNIVQLKHCFYTNGNKPDEVYLNLVLEFVPETVHSASKSYQKQKNQLLPLLVVKLYMYQMLRALAYLHSLGICHRDIKPQNLLVDPTTHTLKICDFGSAKVLVKGEPNVSYICSRYYRAPELIFGATDYTTAIDVWSAGCVGAELMIGSPLFPGDSGVDQLVEIIKVLGTPSKEDIRTMNCSYSEFKFPQIKSHPWTKVLRHAPPEMIDFISRLLVYTPAKRLTALEALAHPIFDELRDPATVLPNGAALPALFNFSRAEMAQAPELFQTLIPPCHRNSNNWPPPASTSPGTSSPSEVSPRVASLPRTLSPSRRSAEVPAVPSGTSPRVPPLVNAATSSETPPTGGLVAASAPPANPSASAQSATATPAYLSASAAAPPTATAAIALPAVNPSVTLPSVGSAGAVSSRQQSSRAAASTVDRPPSIHSGFRQPAPQRETRDRFFGSSSSSSSRPRAPAEVPMAARPRF